MAGSIDCIVNTWRNSSHDMNARIGSCDSRSSDGASRRNTIQTATATSVDYLTYRCSPRNDSIAPAILRGVRVLRVMPAAGQVNPCRKW